MGHPTQLINKDGYAGGSVLVRSLFFNVFVNASAIASATGCISTAVGRVSFEEGSAYPLNLNLVRFWAGGPAALRVPPGRGKR